MNTPKQTSSVALKTLIKMAAVLSVLLLASAVSAQDCSADADCDDGFICEVYGSGGSGVICTSTPDGDEECEESETFEEFGECVPAPVRCSSDLDCSGGLSCLYGGGDDSDPAPPPEPGEDDGNKDPIDEGVAFAPEADGVCGWGFEQCSDDVDCGEFGECIAVGSVDCGDSGATPAPDCGPDEDCGFQEDPIDCESEEFFACVPREIECESDSECPSDWHCEEISYGYCEGSEGGSTGGDPDDGGVDPDDDGNKVPEPPPENLVEDEGDGQEEPDCFEEVQTLCVPPGVGYYGTDDSGGFDDGVVGEEGEPENPFPNGNDDNNDDGPFAPDDDNSDDEGNDDEPSGENGQDGGVDEEDGGCTVVGLGQKTSGGAMLTLLLGMVALGFRRRGRA